MNTVEIKGIIKYEEDDCRKIILTNEKSDNFDLVDEFEDAVSKYGKEVQVNYWVTDKPCTKDEMLEAYLKKVFGAIEAEYEDYYTGSWTYGSQSSYGEYEKRGSLTIGGHDLFNELADYDGKFIIIELNFKSALAKK